MSCQTSYWRIFLNFKALYLSNIVKVLLKQEVLTKVTLVELREKMHINETYGKE